LTERAAAWAPVRQLGAALGIGVVAGALLAFGFVTTGSSVHVASETAFSIGALVFGFAIAVWATTVWIGDAFAAYLEIAVGDTEWSKQSAGAAFSLLSALGLGAMVGSSLATALLRLLG